MLFVYTFFALFCYLFVTHPKYFVTFAPSHYKSTKEMAKKKAAPKAKEPIRIRFKKLANGNQSIYLDVYTEGQRSYEFLKLYLIPETDAAARIQNQNTMQAANAIKAQRILDLTNGKAHITKKGSRSEILLIDYLNTLDNEKSYSTYKRLILSLKAFGAQGITLAKVDEAFLRSFVEFLKNKYISRQGRPLTPKTIHQYYTMLTIILKRGVLDGIIEVNPTTKLTRGDKPKETESNREYLEPEEVERLKNTPCTDNGTKEAFLFSCNCGLRISDIYALTWGDITDRNGGKAVKITMQKTKDPIIIKLGKTALEYLPERGEKADTDNVFTLATIATIERTLKKWAAAAKVNKVLTFHVARHTFATTLITRGVDIYTVSKLLGHKDVAVTQIYAKIVDKKRDDAIDLIDGIL